MGLWNDPDRKRLRIVHYNLTVEDFEGKLEDVMKNLKDWHEYMDRKGSDPSIEIVYAQDDVDEEEKLIELVYYRWETEKEKDSRMLIENQVSELSDMT